MSFDELRKDYRAQVLLDNARAIAESLMQHQAMLADQQERATRMAMWAAIAAAAGTVVQAATALWQLLVG